MKKLLQILMIAIAGILTVSCSANTPVEKLNDICEDVEKNWEEFTENDWIELQQKLDQIDNELAEYECTAEELKEIGKVRGRILKYQAKQAMQGVHEEMKDAANVLEGMFEGLLEEEEE